jgi:hypothetical protein
MYSEITSHFVYNKSVLSCLRIVQATKNCFSAFQTAEQGLHRGGDQQQIHCCGPHVVLPVV